MNFYTSSSHFLLFSILLSHLHLLFSTFFLFHGLILTLQETVSSVIWGLTERDMQKIILMLISVRTTMFFPYLAASHYESVMQLNVFLWPYSLLNKIWRLYIKRILQCDT